MRHQDIVEGAKIEGNHSGASPLMPREKGTK